jgi:hypothetical protein
MTFVVVPKGSKHFGTPTAVHGIVRSMIPSMWRLVVLCLFATSAAAQKDSPGDDANPLLLEVRKKVMLTVNRLPKYMCMETVDRSTFRPKAKVKQVSCDDLANLRKRPDWSVRKETSDRLRLDVAILGDSEMFSWAGEARFRDRSLADLVRRGATSTGAFVSFLNSIFGTGAANFTYSGDVEADGRALVAFAYRVPLERSRYRLEDKWYGGIVAYNGAFLVDPKTFDLVRLTVHADGIPPELNVCGAVTTLEYGSVRLHNSAFLLPKEVRLQAINADGNESENRTVFSGCHEFLAESSLKFDEAAETVQGAAQTTVPKALALLPGLPFRLALTQPIDTATAAAGDPIKAKLAIPIKDKHSGVIVPAGTAVTGRIVQIERRYGPVFESLTLAFKLESVEANTVSQPFDARLEPVVKKHSKTGEVIGPGLEIAGTTAVPK